MDVISTDMNKDACYMRQIAPDVWNDAVTINLECVAGINLCDVLLCYLSCHDLGVPAAMQETLGKRNFKLFFAIYLNTAVYTYNTLHR